MPLSNTIEEEGVLIPPTLLLRDGKFQSCGAKIDALLFTRPGVLSGDFAAQLGANLLAVDRLQGLVESYGAELYSSALTAVNDYGRRLSLAALGEIAGGIYSEKVSAKLGGKISAQYTRPIE